MEEAVTVDAICREYIAKARQDLPKLGTHSAENIKALGASPELDKMSRASLSPLEVVTAVWAFLNANRDDGMLRVSVCSSSWALTDMNQQFENQLLIYNETH